MKGMTAACVSSLVVAIFAWVQPARSDSADATCNLTRSDDTKNRKASGSCKFSQRQGHVTIEMKNGMTVELSPTKEANHYIDDKGQKVVRTASGNRHAYTWRSGRELTVEFESSGRWSGDRWDSSGSGRDRQEITCESRNKELQNCKVSRLDEKSVRLERELGGPGCINGKTWGTQPGLIWVESGCRGVFSYETRRSGSGGHSGDGSSRDRRQLTCQSRYGNRESCSVPNLDLGSVSIERVLSDKPCKRDDSWGAQQGEIWVDGGCRAVFSYRVND